MIKKRKLTGRNWEKGILHPRIFLLIGAFAALLAGMLIYVLFRHSNLLVYKIAGKPSFLEKIYHHPAQNRLMNILAYNIPDALWLLSGILFIRALWLDQDKKSGIYILIFCFLAILWELLQFFGILPGTFDVLDLLAMVSAAFGERVFYTYFVKRRINYAD
jgi:hypothetical protein